MPQLRSLKCPSCGRLIAGTESTDRASMATQFDDCDRRCEPCGIGASNAADPAAVTYIHRDQLGNSPIETRDGAIEALGQAFNVRNRGSKRRRFGFSTSEDAVTWVVFTHLLRSGQLLGTLRHAGITAETTPETAPTLLLWGVPADNGAPGEEIRKQLGDLCASLQDCPNSLSKPDVIIDLGEAGLVFIEVKHRSGNDLKPADYPSWSRYVSAARLGWPIEDVEAPGCYELARNWCLLKGVSGERPATLANLGPARPLGGAEGACLDRLVVTLGADPRPHSMKVTWPSLLGSRIDDVPEWFSQFCRSRGLTE